ncbi:hypothetical protein EDF54_2839 [Rathayibacter sp. PhB93]|uniref:hypothetical protein n=1 Tax=unclassified Rathayibacter TaxID=2609250 RepID=UPI000F4A9755|nr:MULTISPECIES: hypothetical protein [unclassified Rathayibacter]ROQ04628.1 hypothetical protein EDF54_2839 [Rathayibacter sp. PhB93]TDQ13466.1 hypothetical protein EDF17_2074 [Rathayibacter sp. PhB1]
MTTEPDLSGFEGEWEMDPEKSLVWDKQGGKWVPEWVQAQHMTLHHEGDTQIYTVRIQIADDLATHMGYKSRFGDPTWVPYSVWEIEGDQDHELLKPNDVLKSGTVLNEPIAWVVQTYVNPQTHYRITKNLDGSAQYSMSRLLSNDGSTILSAVTLPDGTPSVSKTFIRA